MLSYRQRAYGGDWQNVDEPVYLTYTDCHYGGQRVWFVCPCCDQRAANLYSHIPNFICRRCCQLPYQSQGETRLDRAVRKERKIRRKLGVDKNMTIPILFKPKGMHWSTFTRLRIEAEQVSQVQVHEMMKHVGRLQAQMGDFL